MNFKKQTSKALNNLQKALQNEMATKNLDSSGGASSSLEVRGNQLLGNDYIFYLDKGRGPGKFPPTLLEWIRRKLGIEGAEARGIDFVIRRKIAREGTEIYKNNSLGIELDKHIDEMLSNLIKEVPEQMKLEALKWL